MLKSSLCDYSDAYILVKGKITITGRGADTAARQADGRDKGVEFKNYAPLINCISEINNTQVDNAKDIDIVMPMYNLIEYSNNNAKSSGCILTWSSTCVITNSTGAGSFTITDTKLYVPVVTLLTEDNSKLLQQLKSGFKRTVNWNKYLSKPELLA